jgi:hypothetical protein
VGHGSVAFGLPELYLLLHFLKFAQNVGCESFRFVERISKLRLRSVLTEVANPVLRTRSRSWLTTDAEPNNSPQGASEDTCQ